MTTLLRRPPDPTLADEPFIAAETQMREFTVRALIVGTLLGIVFGASSLYLTLKVGLTVSASIPVAVISLALFRTMSRLFGFRDATILEHNITQTAGSAGESIAFGVGVTMPAILILGFDLELTRVAMVAILGGLLGILMMIPLRRALIVKEHLTLKYPEGTACAAVLKAGASQDCRSAASPAAQEEMRQAEAAGLGKSPGAQVIFTGFGVGLLYKMGNAAFHLWKEVSGMVFGAPLAGGSVAGEISPELLGVGYIIGPRIASIMCAGGVLAYLVLIPLIKFFGQGVAGAVAPGTAPISGMGPDQIRGAYILYIGAGAVATGGLVSLFRSLPTIWHGLRAGLRDVGFSRSEAVMDGQTVPRTDRDLPMSFVGIGLVILIIGIIATPALKMNALGALLIIVFGFLFVTVSSRLTGEIGSSSNPISGMTVATLLFTCLIFLLIGWTGGAYYVTALSVGAVVCIAASNGGTTSQDLKTGYLLGSTPRNQQIAILFGAFASALVLGPILLQLNNAATVYVPIAQVAPGLHTDVAGLTRREAISGPQAKSDTHQYLAWQKTDTIGGPAGKYLVDDTGTAVWLVDPGVNGTFTQRPDGSQVRKFNAPKAVLVSYIIKGILDRKLPWALVLLGVMIALVLEMSGVPSLAFAVGVYLPLSSSSPIFIGGLIRWLVDARQRRHLRSRDISLSEEQLMAESDKSPGVLLSSGYIAGGAIAGIVIAIVQGAFSDFDAKLTNWATAHDPFFNGGSSDLLSLVPFLGLCVLLYLVGRERLLSNRRRPDRL
jgi:putative OPT family oligopeptide transporter